MAAKGKIGVLIEEHFDLTEYKRFNEYFPSRGYEVEYISHLWGNKELRFSANPENGVIGAEVTVSTEVNDVSPSDYKGIIAIGAYAMDRLRYQANVKKGQKNNAPAVAFLRTAEATPGVKLGTICIRSGCSAPTRTCSRAAGSPAPTTSSAMSKTRVPKSCTTAM